MSGAKEIFLSYRSRPLFSVVLATRNRTQSLQNTLQCLKRQSFPHSRFEVLVVDNGSTDQTCAMVHFWMRRFAGCRYFFLGERNVSLARNLGAREARGIWLAFTDDDCLPPANWLMEAANSLKKKRGVPSIGGPVLDHVPAGFVLPPGFIPSGWEQSYGKKERFLRPYEAFTECNFFIRKKCFLQLGGFRPEIGPGNLRFGFHEGTELQHRLEQQGGRGAKRWYVPNVQMRHVVRVGRVNFAARYWRAFLSGYDHTRAFPPKQVRPSVDRLLRLGANILGFLVFLPAMLLPVASNQKMFARYVFRIGEMFGELLAAKGVFLSHGPEHARTGGPIRRFINQILPLIKKVLRATGARNIREIVGLAKKNQPAVIQGLIHHQLIPSSACVYQPTGEQCHPPHPRLAFQTGFVSAPGRRVRIKDARASGPTPAVFDQDYSLVRELSPDWGKDGMDLGVMRVPWLPTEKRLPGRTFMAARLGGETYFHWMTDVMPMLLWEMQKESELGAFRQFLTHPQKKSFHDETFRRLGIPEERIHLLEKRTVYRCESLTVHSAHHTTGRCPEATLRSVAEFFLPPKTRNTSGPERLMILRGTTHSRPLQDREAIVAELKGRGFTDYEPAHHSIVDQARTFQRARIIVATHGAALANLIFCRPGTVLVELFSAQYVNPCYLHIAQQLGIRHFSVLDQSVPHGVVHELRSPSEPIRVTWNQVRSALRSAGL